MEQLIAVVNVLRIVAPILSQLIQAAEQMLPASGKGAAKLELVRGWINAALEADKALAPQLAVAWPAVQTAVAVIVAAYNASGTFKKAS